MDYLPLFHNLRNQPCLVVGGGEVALRKIRTLLSAGADVTVVARAFHDGLRELAHEYPALELRECDYSAALMIDVVLVIAATDDEALNTSVSRDARQQRIPVNVVDSPELCTVIFPAIVDRSPLQIAISTGGTAPVLARLVRSRLESWIPASYGRLAQLAERYRNRVKAIVPTLNQRRAFWEKVLEGPTAEAVFSGDEERAEQEIEALLADPERPVVGEVYLVGAGPGDPDLLTFRALRLMQQADIVLYDRLVSKEVMALVRRDAELIYVGKTAGDHPVTQENINRKLVEYAQQGRRVLRLKGGDPFIFGRGGEEIAHLADEGIPFQVVPGITAASGCASYAGIPLTHRDYAQSVRFITGHQRDGTLNLPWSELTTPGQTLVFYMGLNGLETICTQLIRHGQSEDMPAALIEKGTSHRQRVFTGTLASLPGIVRRGEARAPTLIIVGHVVSLRDRLNWFQPT